MILAAGPMPELPWQAVAGLVVFTTTLVIMARRRAARQILGPRASTRRKHRQDDAPRGGEADIRDLLIELEKAAREITAQIDTRFRKLELLARATDARIAELRRLNGGADVADPLSDGLAAPATGIDVTIGDEGEASATSRDEARPTPTNRSADFDRVCDLADSRLSAGEIASRLSRPIGEVELILALRQQRALAAAAGRPQASGRREPCNL